LNHQRRQKKETNHSAKSSTGVIWEGKQRSTWRHFMYDDAN